jgi:two-component system NtrC family sensor kinase
MRQAVDRLSMLMRDLLSFAQSMSLEMASVDPHQLLEDTMSIYRVKHDSAFPEIKLVSPPKLPPIMMDRSRMVQVLVNLIENANKHAQGVTRVTLSTEVVDGGSVLRIRVADDGAGIAPENLPHIFDPFFSTRKGAGGTGLGLAIVRRIVEGHGGRITADSPPKSGAIFTIDLPTKHTGHTKTKI